MSKDNQKILIVLNIIALIFLVAFWLRSRNNQRKGTSVRSSTAGASEDGAIHITNHQYVIDGDDEPFVAKQTGNEGSGVVQEEVWDDNNFIPNHDSAEFCRQYPSSYFCTHSEVTNRRNF